MWGDDDAHETYEHGQGLELEPLVAGRGVIPRVLNQRGHTQQRLSARQPEEHAGEEAALGTVRVGGADVDDTEELWEEEDVDEVGAQVPHAVDGMDDYGQCRRRPADQ